MLTAGSIGSFSRLKTTKLLYSQVLAESNCTTTSCQGATSANLPWSEHLQSSHPWPGAGCHQEILQLVERYININGQTPPRDAQNTMTTLHPHSFSRVVWAQHRRHSVEKASPRGWDCPAGLAQPGLAVPCWNKKWLARCLLRVHRKMSPMRQVRAAQRGSPKNKNNSPNPNKAKLLSSTHPALHHPNNSNLTPHLQFLPLLTLK